MFITRRLKNQYPSYQSNQNPEIPDYLLLQPLSVTWFQQQLEQLPQAKHYWIALSGGMDSRVLLELCAQLQDVDNKYSFSAIHINHQLQAQADQWAQFCIGISTRLKINCVVESVKIQRVEGKSQEQVARDARRAIFSQIMSNGDMLLTAHHLNDQAETVLLRVFRGSGITGLAGIRPCVEFARGWMARPLLSVSRQQLFEYATQGSLQWVQDPSNQDHDYDRNYIRHVILTQIEKRWPSIQNTLARNAEYCLQANSLLTEIARKKLKQIICDNNALLISELISLEDAMQNLLIREWFAHHQVGMPSSAIIQRIKQEVITARIDSSPCFSYQYDGLEYHVRRYRNQLFLVQSQPSYDTTVVIQWDGKTRLKLPSNIGCLKVIDCAIGGISRQLWDQSRISVRFRSGGETCLLPGRVGRRSLKTIFQELGVPPWERSRVPLIYLDDELAAIGMLLVCEPFYVTEKQPAIQLKLE